MDKRDEIWGDRLDKAYSSVTYHPWRVVIKVIIGIFLLSAVIGLIGLPMGWWSGTKNLVTFQHSQQEVTAVLDDWTGLQAAACNAKNAQDAQTNSGDPTLLEDPAFAYKARYRSIKQDYDRRMNNFFEAKLTRGIPLPGGISDLPRFAPSLTDGEREWCG